MGTKNNLGAFDCYEAAKPDEPMFVLLGRDRHAARVVEFWINLRISEGETGEQISEAMRCVAQLREYRAKAIELKRKG